MKTFKQCCDVPIAPASSPQGGAGKQNKQKQTGALFLGVFRGKLAEGIDFADSEARAVLIIGSAPHPIA